MDSELDPALTLSRRSFIRATAGVAAAAIFASCGDSQHYSIQAAGAPEELSLTTIQAINEGGADASQPAVRLHPPKQFNPWEPGETIYEVPNPNNWVVLRGDDGPWPKTSLATDKILTDFGLRGRASFAWRGDGVADNPDVARELYEAGYEIINHSKTHSFYSDRSNAAEIEPADEIFERILGKRPDTYAGPGLIGGPLITAELTRLGKCATSTRVFIGDTDTNPKLTKEQITAKALAQTKSGSILVFHPETAFHEPTRQALPYILDGLLNRGMVFVTPRQLLSWRYDVDGNRKPGIPVIRLQKFEPGLDGRQDRFQTGS